ncbi:sulfotransferase [Bauldia sp.]|uniref:sulfotransferase n=1 Tax=Bauldia sp. TaxID=2575872 RepID=UPI003BAD7729
MTDPVFLLGVGAQKCGTSWLHEQLAAQVDIMMSPIKELHYWDRRFHPDFFAPRETAKLLTNLVKKKGDAVTSEVDFERIAMDCGENYYLAYFQSRLRPHHRALGEISPSYSVLSANEFGYIRRFLPYPTKAIFLMRDPVERVWSQCRMQAKKATGRGRDVTAEHLFRRSIDRKKIDARTGYDNTVRNLLEAFPRDDIFFGFFETLFSAQEMERLADFIGIGRLDVDLVANPNKGAAVAKPDPAVWSNVRAHHADVYAFVLKQFGSQVPESWQV